MTPDIPSDSTPLLKNKPLHSSTPRSSYRCPFVLELVAVLYFFAYVSTTPILTQYIYERVSEEVVGGNVSLTDVNLCNDTRDNATVALQEEIRAVSARWNVWTLIAFGVTSVITTMFLGSYTDRHGRKIAIVLPCFCDMLQLAVISITIYFKLHLSFLVAGKAIGGLGGSFSAMIMGIFSSTVDECTLENRSFRLTILEIVLLLSAAASFVVIGVYIQYAGFLLPCITCLGIMVIALCTSALMISTKPVENGHAKSSRKNILSYFKDTLKLFLPNIGGRRNRILLLLLIFLTFGLSHMGKTGVTTLYLIGSPFCWDSQHIGFLNAAITVVPSLGSALCVRVLGKGFNVPDLALTCLGACSAILSYCTMMLAETSWQLYLVPLAALLVNQTLPMIRSEASKYVEANEQGALFATMAVLESLCGSVGSAGLNAVYGATQVSLRGAVFLLQAGLALLAVGLVGALTLYNRNLRSENTGSVNPTGKEALKTGTADSPS